MFSLFFRNSYSIRYVLYSVERQLSFDKWALFMSSKMISKISCKLLQYKYLLLYRFSDTLCLLIFIHRLMISNILHISKASAGLKVSSAFITSSKIFEQLKENQVKDLSSHRSQHLKSSVGLIPPHTCLVFTYPKIKKCHHDV